MARVPSILPPRQKHSLMDIKIANFPIHFSFLEQFSQYNANTIKLLPMKILNKNLKGNKLYWITHLMSHNEKKSSAGKIHSWTVRIQTRNGIQPIED